MRSGFISASIESDRSVPVSDMREKKTDTNTERSIIKRLKKSNLPKTVQGVKYYECPVCRKQFSTYLFSGWAYKIKYNSHLLMFCGYSCMRKAENLAPDIRKRDKELGA